MDRVKVATVWLGGCAGCHMSFLDLDEFLIDLAELVDIVYSPVVDIKEFPCDVDVTLVEGAVCNEDNEHIARIARARSKYVVSFGDCAVTGNVPAMRNPLGSPKPILTDVYVTRPDAQAQMPGEPGIMPELLPRVSPLHEVIKVDGYIPGCPPPADRIKEALVQLLQEGAIQLAGKSLKPG